MSDRNFLNRKYVLIGGIILLVLFGLYYFSKPSKSANKQVSSKIEIKDAISSFDINRDFTYPLRDSKNKEVSKLIITIDKAELRDELVIKSKKTVASKGRVFLVVNIKIKNDYNKPVKIASRDYFRLMRNGNEEERLAAEYHNDPVEVQAISTKPTRLAFVVNDSDRDFVLQVGEIEGDKEKLNLDLK